MFETFPRACLFSPVAVVVFLKVAAGIAVDCLTCWGRGGMGERERERETETETETDRDRDRGRQRERERESESESERERERQRERLVEGVRVGVKGEEYTLT